ncbi:polysaccharide pyruvyl transferase [Hydrogenimonas sp.]|nr:polysaccharide pyruvyl transferase [Hydrogenimonas sp.]
MGRKIVISGWYGPGNIGDEAILQAMIDIFEKEFKECEITVLSFDPGYTKKTQGVDAVMQYPSGKRRWLKSILSLDIFATLKAIRECDLFVMGGGGFLSDWQPNVPKDWLKQFKVAKYFGKETWLYRIGAGPFLTDAGRETTRYYIDNYVDRVSVRDRASHDELVKSAGVKKSVEIEIDPVANICVERYMSGKKSTKSIGIIYTEYFKNRFFRPEVRDRWESLFNAYCAQIQAVIEQGFTPRLIFFQKSIEEELAKKFLDIFGDSVTVEFPGDYKEAISMMESSRGIISFRLHGNILAYAMKKPFLPIIYHHKTAGFLEQIGYGNDSLRLEVGDGENWRESEIDIEEWRAKTVKFIEKIK